MGSTRINLTKKAIEAITAKERRQAVLDTHTRGLLVRIEPTGQKSFCWLRKVNGRKMFRHLGLFPDLSVENARGKAAELNSKFARWKSDDYNTPDPFERRHDLTLGGVLEDYCERQLRPHAKRPDRAVKGAKWQFDRYLAHWRGRHLGSLRRQDVIALHAAVGQKHGQVTANRTVTFVRTLYNWALNEMNWHGENPVRRRFKFFAERSRERFLQKDELARLFKALKEEPSGDLRDFIVLALFTGARRSDILSARWSDINFETSTWTIPNPKSRVPYLVPLLPEAVERLQERLRHSASSEWVFPGTGATGHLTGFKHSWVALLKRAELTNLRIHDLRRTLGSWMATGGTSLPIIGKALGHVSLGATETYARLQLEAVRQATEAATRRMLQPAKNDKTQK